MPKQNNILYVYKMTSLTSCDIEEVIEQVSEKRISLRKGIGFVYNGHDTVYYLRYFLRCLGLKTSGTKEELIARIEDAGIKRGEIVYDSSVVENGIVLNKLDEYPMYLLQVYLKEHEQLTSGSRKQLVERIKEYHKAPTATTSYSPEKKLIASAIYAVNSGKLPTDEAIDTMEKHGYFYDAKFNTFINAKTHEKILGKKSWLESFWFMTYPLFPDSMEFISMK